MAADFEYVDLMEGHIKSLESRNNKFDPTGKLNELRIPPKRQQQAASRPQFYNADQHSASPYLSAELEAPSTLSLKTPYSITVTLRHNSNPAGNPENKPVTFALEDTALTEIDDTNVYPWLILHHEANSIKEVDDGNNGPARPFEDNAPEEEPTVSLENGYVSLAVGESRKVKINFRYTSDGMLLNQGEKYSINFRGSWVRWWKWGTLEELGGEEGQKRQASETPMIIIAASNLIDFTVEDV